MFDGPFKWLFWLAILDSERQEQERERKKSREEEDERKQKDRDEEEERKRKEGDQKETERTPTISPSLEAVVPSHRDKDDEEDEEDWDDEEDEEDRDDEEDEEDRAGDDDDELVSEPNDEVEEPVSEPNHEVEEPASEPNGEIEEPVSEPNHEVEEPLSEPNDEVEGLERVGRIERDRQRSDYYNRFYTDFPYYHLRFPKPNSPSITEVTSKSCKSENSQEFVKKESRELAILFGNAKQMFHSALHAIYTNFAVAVVVDWKQLEKGFAYICDAEFLAKLDKSWSDEDPTVLTSEGTSLVESTLPHCLRTAMGGLLFNPKSVPLEAAVLIHSVLGASQVRCRLAKLRLRSPKFGDVNFDATLKPPQQFLEIVRAEAKRTRKR